MMRNNR